MRYFIDTEFYEDGKTIDLISIGIVAEDGREFYAVSAEAQLHRVSNWVQDNVLPHLPKYGDPAWMSRAAIRDRLESFVSLPGASPGTFAPGRAYAPDPRPAFWAYYADYDWVAFCQLFGIMLDLPRHFPKFCRDLKQLSVHLGNPQHPSQDKNEHHALADARWNKKLFDEVLKPAAMRVRLDV